MANCRSAGEDSLHRQFRKLSGRNHQPCRLDPAGSLLPGIVVGSCPGDGNSDGGSERRASVDAAVISDVGHADVLLEIGRKLAKPLNAALPWASYEEMMQVAFRSLPSAGGSDSWKTVQQQGGWWGEAEQPAPASGQPAGRKTVATEPRFDGDSSEYPFHLLPYASQAFLDGSLVYFPGCRNCPML